MRIAVKVLNLVIIAVSLAAIVCLFVVKAFTFYANIGLDVNKVSEFVPKTDYTDNIDISKLIGTDKIHFEIEFEMSIFDLNSALSKNKEKIDEKLLKNNIDQIVKTVQEPIDLITEYMIRTTMRELVKNEVSKQIDKCLADVGSPSTAADVLDDLGLTDQYFASFADKLYDAGNSGTATVESLSQLLYQQVDETLALAEDAGQIETSGFDETQKEAIKNALIDVFNQLDLVESGGHVKKIGQIAYIYFAKFLVEQLDGKVDSSELQKKSTEDEVEYVDRLLNIYIITFMPDGFYQIVSYVSLGLFIGIFVFGAIWLILLLITIIRTVSKKCWTIFGPWFWLAGSLQLFLGIGLTIFGKFILPKIVSSVDVIPFINYVVMVPRTYALTLSILYLIILAIRIPYGFIKNDAKTELIEKEIRG